MASEVLEKMAMMSYCSSQQSICADNFKMTIIGVLVICCPLIRFEGERVYSHHLDHPPCKLEVLS